MSLFGVFKIIFVNHNAQFTKKRVIYDFGVNLIKNPIHILKPRAGEIYQNPGSKMLWDTFRSYISLYNKYINKKYILDCFIIKYVAGGYANERLLPGGKVAPDPHHLENINPKIKDAIQAVSSRMAQTFNGAREDICRIWLSTYQFSWKELGYEEEDCLKLMKDCHIVELGAGVGANAAVNSLLTDQSSIIFDLPEMLDVQKVVHAEILPEAKAASFTSTDDVHDLYKLCDGKEYIIFSHWAFTEFPTELRDQLTDLVKGSKLAMFACNGVFEGVDNLAYFKEMSEAMPDKELKIVPVKWQKHLSQHYYVSMG